MLLGSTPQIVSDKIAIRPTAEKHTKKEAETYKIVAVSPAYKLKAIIFIFLDWYPLQTYL